MGKEFQEKSSIVLRQDSNLAIRSPRCEIFMSVNYAMLAQCMFSSLNSVKCSCNFFLQDYL